MWAAPAAAAAAKSVGAASHCLQSKLSAAVVGFWLSS